MTSEVSTEPSEPIELASMTDVGRVRTANEDSCDTFERPDGTQLLVVADGMGGHRGGATASKTAVAVISEVFDENPSAMADEMLGNAIRTANARVYEMAQNDGALEGMGTTVVAFMLDARNRGTVAHVGDSRAYRYRRGGLEPLTTDHSVVAEMQRRGLISAEEAAVHPRRNEILRSVGVSPEVEVDVNPVDVAPGDRFVLCSDGLSGVVSDEEIATVVQNESPQQAVETLIQLANERGGPDNITVQILSIPAIEGEGDPEATAPVELSEIGIEAIESRRRNQKRVQQLGGLFAIAGGAIVIYFLWQVLAGSDPSPAGNPNAPQVVLPSALPPAIENAEGPSPPPNTDTPPTAGEAAPSADTADSAVERGTDPGGTPLRPTADTPPGALAEGNGSEKSLPTPDAAEQAPAPPSSAAAPGEAPPEPDDSSASEADDAMAAPANVDRFEAETPPKPRRGIKR